MSDKRASRVSEELTAYMLRNSGIEDVVVTPESIETEVVRNAVKLKFSEALKGFGEKIFDMLVAGKNPAALAIKEFNSGAATERVNHRHANGHYPKKKIEMIELWQSGKYKTKQQCAEENYQRLNIAYTTAVKYLRGIKK